MGRVVHAVDVHQGPRRRERRRRSSATGGHVPIRFDAAVTATGRETVGRAPPPTASTASSPVAGSNSAQRTVAPTRSAACTHGRMFESWSRLRHDDLVAGAPRRSERACGVVCELRRAPFRTRSRSPSTPSRSASAPRNRSTAASTSRSDSVDVPRFDSGPHSVAATASATGRGVCVPPGRGRTTGSGGRCGKLRL